MPAPDIQFLFRFRDLVAPTLEEHRKIIRERGWCWWGWWKRPAESSRGDVWEALAKATDDRQVWVGLFDSGSGKVFGARVTGIVKPARDGSEHVPKVPDEESEHVPRYYRESPFSRAWMRIVEIDPDPVDFFGKYSFAEPPNLPNYTSATLKRFAGKIIVSAEELTGMDTTIWRIRPAVLSDPHEQIILTVPALADAISAELVGCKSDAILHLTDVHFAVGAARRAQHVWRLESEDGTRSTLVEAVSRAVGGRKIGLVIISGDFTFIGSEEEFEEARVAIAHLLGVLDLSTDHLVIIPGNHDIRWTADKEAYQPNAPVHEAPASAKRNYEDFYRKLMRHEPNRHLAMGRRFSLPCGITVDCCALNSSSLEQDKDFLAGMGRIEQGAFADVAGRLGWEDNRTAALRLLVVHHHLALTENLEPAEGFGKGYGIAVDAVRIQRMAARNRVHLALHGHKHRAFIWRSMIYELPEHAQLRHKLGELSIVGGGSAGSSETEADSNYLNILTVTTSRLVLEIHRCQHQGTFMGFQKWEADLSLSNEGLAMSDWRAA